MKKIFFWIACSVLFAAAFSSCITPRKINYMQPPGMGVPAYNDSIAFEDYRIKVNDRLYMRVYSDDSKMNAVFNTSSYGGGNDIGSGSYTELYTYLVEEDGTALLPALGKVQMEGKTLREAKYFLAEELKPYFKLGSELDVDVRVAGRYYSIIGQSTSGRFNLPRDKITIFQALAQAGDIGIYGDRSHIRILRETPEGTLIRTFDLRSADIINSEFYYVEPDDVIYIKSMYEQVFGITHITTLFSVVLTTISFGIFLFNFKF